VRHAIAMAERRKDVARTILEKWVSMYAIFMDKTG
jgi:hypothetical protein